ncbi:MAG TPA: acyl-CoA dehydrogenase family protein [Solirubrobacterales bacterium]|nr:acyl-CoA dehydrogenase family protein [Solirubrobacterales bacterium]
MAWDFSTEPDFEAKLQWMQELVRDEILPLETLDLDFAGYRRAIVPLQERVKEAGLWAAHLPPDLGGQGLGQVKLALMHEILGATDYAPPVFGNQAPDSGNSELIAIAGDERQKERWLKPLLSGALRSAFTMTEEGTGSDPTQLRTSAVGDGAEWVIDGTKWFISNADKADFHIVMALTDPDAAPHLRMSMIIVPADAAGITVRDLGVMNDPAARNPIHTHSEVTFEGVRVPTENLLGERGGAFALAQARLGPGRIHHAMRWLGVCRRAFDMLCERAVSKSVHGSTLAEKQTIQNWVAESAAEMQAARMMTLHAAWKLDQVGAKEARDEIAMIKYHGPKVMYNVLDRAIQVHGSLGFSCDLPLEEMYRYARASRIYDGPDEVHRVGVARRILRGYQPVEVPTEHIPTRRAAAQVRFAELLDGAAAN